MTTMASLTAPTPVQRRSLWTSNLQTDNDSDGCQDAGEDADDDNDGTSDTDDAFPLDSSESVDTDADGIGDNTDTDDDGDGFLDIEDDCPKETGNSTRPLAGCLDSDGDGWNDPLSTNAPTLGEIPSICTYLNPSQYGTTCSTQTNSVFSSIASNCASATSWQPCNQEYEMEFNLTYAPMNGNLIYTISKGSSYIQQNANIYFHLYMKNFSDGNWDLLTFQNGLAVSQLVNLNLVGDSISQNNTVELKINLQNAQVGQTGSIQFNLNSIQFNGYDHAGDAFPYLGSSGLIQIWMAMAIIRMGSNQILVEFSPETPLSTDLDAQMMIMTVGVI